MTGREDLFDKFFLAITRELDRVQVPLELDTLYFGGGTPSHLGSEGLRRLFDSLEGTLCVCPGAEVTIEANPSDITKEFVKSALACQVSRVSLGAQSLNNKTLRALDRQHLEIDVRRAVELLLAEGFAVNIDVMTAAPGQSLDEGENDLAAVVALGVHHVSVYCLTWEKGTRFESMRLRGELSPVSESIEESMFEMAIDRLEEGGFSHYEVSNFARSGFRCRHNEMYWDCRPWEAFGPSAARFDGRTRLTNHRSPTTWMQRVLEGIDPVEERDAMTDLAAARERVVLGLRRRDGLDRTAFFSVTGFSLDNLIGELIARWVLDGLAQDNGQQVRLTRPGLLVSDALWGDVLLNR